MRWNMMGVVFALAWAVAATQVADAGCHKRMADYPIDYGVKPWLPESVQRTADEALISTFANTQLAQYGHDILINRPDYILFVPTQPMADKDVDITRPGDTYNDHVHVIYDERRDRLFAFWTQATWESGHDQHIAFSQSYDRGRHWTSPQVLAGSSSLRNPTPIASWQQPMISRSGRIYVLWNQQTTSRETSHGEIFGTWTDTCGSRWEQPRHLRFPQRSDLDADDPFESPQWCNWQRPLRLGTDGRYFVGSSRTGKAPYDAKKKGKTEFWQYENIDEDPPVDQIRISVFNANRDAFEVDEAKAGFNPDDPENSCIQEPSIVKLPDGRLFSIMRSSFGHPVWSQSRDGGRTWDRWKVLKDKSGKPFLHPRSPCPMYDWKGCEAGSGTYFALIHNTFDFKARTAFQNRGPLYLIAGTFDPEGDQPVAFAEPKLFAPRRSGNSFYTSYTVIGGKGVLWFNDDKFYILGREIGREWFK